MAERTSHGEERHEDEERPTSEALHDKAETSEIYLDIESEYFVLSENEVGRIFLPPKVSIIRAFGQPNGTVSTA